MAEDGKECAVTVAHIPKRRCRCHLSPDSRRETSTCAPACAPDPIILHSVPEDAHGPSLA
jgi:hypothetical protein